MVTYWLRIGYAWVVGWLRIILDQGHSEPVIIPNRLTLFI